MGRKRKLQNKRGWIRESSIQTTAQTDNPAVAEVNVTDDKQKEVTSKIHKVLQNNTQDGRTEMKKNNSFKEWLKTTFCKTFEMSEGLYIGKLEMNLEHRDEKYKVQKLSIGRENHNPTKVILLVGATGTGKTTLINAMANYIFQVEFQDDFRFKIVDNIDNNSRSQAHSQTDYITAFAFYHSFGMPFAYNYILIDTPGFGDTRGIERDQEMMAQLETFLKQSYGISQVNGIGFVIPASQTRLTQTQKYVLDGLLSMFGKDVKKNIFVMTTFSDARKPPVLKCLDETGLEYTEIYKFNNSALFAPNKKGKYTFGGDSESDNEDEVTISKQYWDMATKNMNNFFTNLGKMMPVSLTLTKEVLEEKRHLQTVVYSLQQQVHIGLSNLSTLNQEREMLARLDDDIEGSRDYSITVEVPKIHKITLNRDECVTNCTKCSFTCHFPCHLPQNSNKKRCAAMANGICKVCPENCAWDLHCHMTFRCEATWNLEIRTAHDLLERYNRACLGKLTKISLIHEMERDIKNHAQTLIKYIKDIQKCVERLEEIALKPNPVSTIEYIDLLVQSEKMQKLKHFEKRIEMLLKLKEEVKILEAASSAGANLPEAGEALLEHFQQLMVQQ
ncbi:hypothetical protein SK128_000576 [Halocaridina rubra]|uniref:4Fe-4S ferredoxin-type domain-containing protein n=1 Tax=Halocaridina rubra TaxID=373956 RepID=A0AAN8X290_HALRR